MKKWEHTVLPLTRSQIEIAIRDPGWQKFRLSLIGLPTRYKLTNLHRYLTELGDLSAVKKDAGSPLWIEQRRREWRVSNYINALRRSGHLNDKYEVVK